MSKCVPWLLFMSNITKNTIYDSLTPKGWYYVRSVWFCAHPSERSDPSSAKHSLCRSWPKYGLTRQKGYYQISAVWPDIVGMTWYRWYDQISVVWPHTVVWPDIDGMTSYRWSYHRYQWYDHWYDLLLTVCVTRLTVSYHRYILSYQCSAVAI